MRDNRFLLVTDKNGAAIGRLRENDGISNCKITEKQGDNSTLSFDMLVSSSKYALLADPENLIYAGGRVFSFIYDGESVDEKKDSGNKNTASFNLTERQCLLDKVMITAYNSTTTYDHIDNGMVVILSGGIAPLTVNGVDISEECPYEKGLAAYALYAVLYGTGWDVGTVDVPGAYDLESDKKSVLENVKAIAEKWGGILIFDSLNKKISLRAEEAYKPYNGYGVRFKFNETGLNRTINRNIITRLYVYGKDNLNIASANGGKEYLEDYSYTSTPLCGIMQNNDITNAGDLVLWGKRELEKVCRPQITLKLSLIDRAMLEGGVSFEVSDIIDVYDEDLADSKYQARVTEKSYSYFQPWECTVTVGDEKEVLAAKIKYAIESTRKVNALTDLMGRISSDDINMSGTNQSMTSYVQLTNEALEAGFKVIGVDGYERTGKTTISADGIDVYNGGITIRDLNDVIKIYMDGQTGNIIFAGDLHGAGGTFSGALSAASGTFTGELVAASGSFSGKVTASSGDIGNWEILDGGIINKDNSLALTSDGQIIAASGNFIVDSDGKLTAKGATIVGVITAESGEIGGWIIGNDTIKAKNGCMVLHSDGTIEGLETTDEETGEKYSGKLISKTGDEKTEISGGRINMYCFDSELDDYVKEAAIYTNSNFGGGLCLEAVDGRPIVFGVDGAAVAKIMPAEKDSEGNVTKQAYFVFRSGTEIHKEKVKTGYVEETDPEWYSNIAVSDTALVFTSGNRVDDNNAAKTYSFGLTRDSDGKITQITDESGNVTAITRS